MNDTLRYRVDIKTRPQGEGDLTAFLDMLRYEGGRVVSWDRIENGFRVTIEVEQQYFQPDRWASFLIFPTLVS